MLAAIVAIGAFSGAQAAANSSPEAVSPAGAAPAELSAQACGLNIWVKRYEPNRWQWTIENYAVSRRVAYEQTGGGIITGGCYTIAANSYLQGNSDIHNNPRYLVAC